MKALSKDDLKAEAGLSEDADLIVNRTAHFVGNWIEEHVIEKPAIVPVGVDAAEELASQCIADAKDEGIAAEDIQDEIGDLKEYIAETIVEEGVHWRPPMPESGGAGYGAGRVPDEPATFAEQAIRAT